MRIRMRTRQPSRLIFLFAVVWLVALPLLARQMTVAQLQKVIEDAKAQKRDDDFVVKKLAGVKLANRLSVTTLQQLQASSPGPKTAQVLRYIADAAIFLDPPANEIPSLPAPDVEAQKAMIRQAIHYVAHTLHALPNFTATRVTQQLVDSPQGLEKAQLELLGGVYLVNTFRAPITLRDGKETEEGSVADGWKVAATAFNSSKSTVISIASGPAIGLTAHGEFGPILASVILDVAKGKLNWARWEAITGKPVAVFQFSVEKAASHFSVDFSQAAHVEVVDSRPPPPSGPQFSGRTYNTGQARSLDAIRATDDKTVNKQLAYHGELAMDPDSGAILRISIEAARTAEDPMKRAAMMVEYGPIQVGEATYICPTHSVALSTTQEENRMITVSAQTMTEVHINDAQFVGYHRFGSESTLVMNSPPSEGEPTASPQPSQSQSGTQSSQPAVSTTDVASASPEPPVGVLPASQPTTATAETISTAKASTAEPAPSVSIAAVETVADEEILVRAADGLPGTDTEKSVTTESGNSQAAATSTFTLKPASRLVDLSLVATNKRGKPLTDLKQEDIEVYDNGRKQQLVAFRLANGGNHVIPDPSSQQVPRTFTNAAVAADALNVPDLQLFLLDETQLSNADLNRSRTDLLHFLKSSSTSSRVAIYAVGAHGLSVIQETTLDHAQALASLTAWTPVGVSGQQLQRNGQAFDSVQSTKSLDLSTGGAQKAENQTSPADADPEIRPLGNHPMRAPLVAIVDLSRRFSAVPGRKSMIWVSGGRALTGVKGLGSGGDKGSEILLTALAHAHDRLNEAHIALFAVDASAAQGSSENVARENHIDAAIADTAGSGAVNAHVAQHQGGGEAKSEATQDQRALLEPVRLLAESTGGRAYGSGSDFKSILDGIDRDSASEYELSFHPDTPDDGTNHVLQVKIANHSDAKLRYRNSYRSAELSSTNQQRFQQAVWNPQDASGIALTAEAIPASDPASGAGTVKLHIALSSVALEQTAGRWTGQLFVYVAQRDDAALKTDVFGNTMHLSLKQATYESDQAAGIPYSCRIEPKSSLGSIRIIVIDGKSGQMGSVTLPSMALHPKG